MAEAPESPLTVAITGANSGIGLRAARRLAAAGHRVYALCRDPGRGAAAVDKISQGAPIPARLLRADMADPASIDAAAERLMTEEGRLDVLITNAAVFDQAVRSPRYTAGGHELFWATNHLGPFLLTARLSPALAAAPRPRVITVASKGLVTMPRIKIRFGELDAAGWYTPTRAYYHAKLAQIMFSYSLALATRGVLDVACVRVPSVRLDPEKVAALPRALRLAYAPKAWAAAPPERLAATYATLATRQTSWTDTAGTGAGEPSRTSLADTEADEPSRTDAADSEAGAPSRTDAADTGGDERARLRGIYVDERERPVNAPAFAYDAAARRRLWDVTRQATGDPAWAWEALTPP